MHAIMFKKAYKNMSHVYVVIKKNNNANVFNSTSEILSFNKKNDVDIEGVYTYYPVHYLNNPNCEIYGPIEVKGSNLKNSDYNPFVNVQSNQSNSFLDFHSTDKPVVPNLNPFMDFHNNNKPVIPKLNPFNFPNSNPNPPLNYPASFSRNNKF